MSKPLPPYPRRQPNHHQSPWPQPTTPPSAASPSSVASISTSVVSMDISHSPNPRSSFEAISTDELDANLTVFGSLGPPGATRRPSRRARVSSIGRTWAWIKSGTSQNDEDLHSPTRESLSFVTDMLPDTKQDTLRPAHPSHPQRLLRRPSRSSRDKNANLKSDSDDESASRHWSTPLSADPALRRPRIARKSSGASTLTPSTPMPMASNMLSAKAPSVGETIASRAPVPSIHDIVGRHSPAVALAEATAKDRIRTGMATSEEALRQSESSDSRSPSIDTSDVDSVVREIRLAHAACEFLTHKAFLSTTGTLPTSNLTPSGTPPHCQNITPSRAAQTTINPSPRSLHPIPSPSTPESSRQHLIRSAQSLLRRKSLSPLSVDEDTRAVAQFVRSPQLNRILRVPQASDRTLQVSLADIGNPDGRPVLVFLGLGCVRYLIALYDELARTLGIRLICIDRWGLGKTEQVSQDRRNLLEWADIVSRVLDEIGVHKFQILAHSVGAPYAVATALKLQHRVKGKIHLLSPWVGESIEGYKWLKWVPISVIKSALAAEWHIESYLLGKAPTVKPAIVIGSSTSILPTEDLDIEGGQSSIRDIYATMHGRSSSPSFSASSSPTLELSLMQASHAESLAGTTADLLSVVLGRESKPWGFGYTDMLHPCKIWYGTHDDRVSEKSMRWMEKTMNAQLLIVQGEGHNLMSSRVVMFDVLDSLAFDDLL